MEITHVYKVELIIIICTPSHFILMRKDMWNAV